MTNIVIISGIFLAGIGLMRIHRSYNNKDFKTILKNNIPKIVIGIILIGLGFLLR